MSVSCQFFNDWNVEEEPAIAACSYIYYYYYYYYCDRICLLWILDAFSQIVQDEGVGALWNGTFPSLLLVLNPAVQFMIYEGLKRQLRRGVHREVRGAIGAHTHTHTHTLL